MSKHRGPKVRGAREHVFALFRGAAERVLEYHHFARTLEIVDACKEIAKGSEVDGEARDLAVLCAWFWDSCYAAGTDDHAKGGELCLAFLDQQQAGHPWREQIAGCFRSVGGSGSTAPGAGDAPVAQDVAASDLLHDARLAVLAAGDYVERVELLRFELQRSLGKTFSDLEWTQHCIAFFGANPYRTRFAQLAYGGGRAANLARLQKLLRKQLRAREEERLDDASGTAKRVARSADNLYYHFTRLQIGLIGIADHRTSTMIHVNAIMLSIVVALLARKIETERDLLLPTVFMLVVNLVVVFLSMSSMRQRKERLSTEEARAHGDNVLSFLNERQYSLPEYTRQMSELVADPPQFQLRVIEHLYFGRKALDERARALRLTYSVFIYGISLSIVFFVLVLARR